jgi:hypothetical protein
MSEEQLKKVMDLFGADFSPEAQEDEVMDFDKPLKGGYRVRIAGLNRYAGESEKCENGVYDMYSLNLQIVETIEGDEGTNRYLSKTYSNVVGKYQDDPEEGKRKLMNDLFTGNVQYDIVREADTTSDQVIEQIAPQLIDQVISVRCYKTKGGKQAVRVVKEIKTTKKSEEVVSEEW